MNTALDNKNINQQNSNSGGSGPGGVPSKRRKKTSYVVGSAVVTVAVFSYLFSHISLADVVSIFKNAYLPGLFMFIALSFVMSFFRAWRYLILLKISGYSPNIFVLYLTVLVGNFFSDLLPARTGSLIYVFISTSRLGVPFAASASSFAISFLFDLLSIAPLLVVIAIGVQSVGNLSIGVVLASSFIVMVISFLCLRALPGFCSWASGKCHRIPLLSDKSREKLGRAIAATRIEIETTQRTGVYKRLFVLSLVIRLLKYSAQYFVLYGLLLPLGYTLAELDVFEVFLGICASESAASMPFAGIAGFGIFEGTWAVVFQLLGYPGHIAKVTSISLHLFVQVYGYVLGAIALGIIFLPIFKVDGVAQAKEWKQESAVYFYGRLILASILVAIGICLFVGSQ